MVAPMEKLCISLLGLSLPDWSPWQRAGESDKRLAKSPHKQMLLRHATQLNWISHRGHSYIMQHFLGVIFDLPPLLQEISFIGWLNCFDTEKPVLLQAKPETMHSRIRWRSLSWCTSKCETLNPINVIMWGKCKHTYGSVKTGKWWHSIVKFMGA